MPLISSWDVSLNCFQTVKHIFHARGHHYLKNYHVRDQPIILLKKRTWFTNQTAHRRRNFFLCDWNKDIWKLLLKNMVIYFQAWKIRPYSSGHLHAITEHIHSFLIRVIGNVCRELTYNENRLHSHCQGQPELLFRFLGRNVHIICLLRNV